MRRAIVALLLAAPAAAGAQTTFSRWQDVGTYAGQQTLVLNRHTQEIRALQAKVATLERDLSLTIGAHDILVRYLLGAACGYNSKVTSWQATLTGLAPLPLGPHTCPPLTQRFYIPAYLGPNGPPLPPQQ